MSLPPSGLPDWRDAASYAALLEVERAGFAWEWLRRDEGYRRAARAALAIRAARGRTIIAAEPAAERWLLHAFEDPDLAAPAARPLWHSEAHPLVLCADAERAEHGPDALDLRAMHGLATIVEERGQARHLLLSDGCRSIRLDLFGAPACKGPVRLRYRIQGLAQAEAPVTVLRRLQALSRGGRFSRMLHPPETRAARFLLMLRAHDAAAAGASQREIAARLLGSEAAEARWRIRAPTLRSQAQRLVRAAAAMARGGWTRLLT